jgi:hypothetical protein
MRRMFPDDEERETFNRISNSIRDTVLDVLALILREDKGIKNHEENDVYEKLLKMDVKDMNTLMKKAEETATFLKKKKNGNKFTD